ncbi:MAG TPA: HAD-IC family P-type ATPase, partial [Verrucomicrobiae bacterium]|nr:HAD-IC family P-type ATPase [Verrucomicrobiae bacterium]
MEATAAGRRCLHCGAALPHRRSSYCCYGCSFAARIIGAAGEGGAQLLRLGIAALLSMNVMTVSVLLYLDAVDPANLQTFRYLLLFLSAPCMLLVLGPFLRGTMREAAAATPAMDTLITVGAVASFGASAWNVLRGSGELYFDNATMLPLLVAAGKFVESGARRRMTDVMSSVLGDLPRRVLRVAAGTSEEVRLEELRPGDLVRVRPGEKFPVDGKVVEGCTFADDAVVTGESLPRPIRVGDRVHAGAVNAAGSVEVRAERTGNDLLLLRTARVAAEAALNAPSWERAAQTASRIFVPLVACIALAAGAWWSVAAGLEKGGLVALAVLVVACPCAFGIAAPLATGVAVARAAREGVAVKGGEVLERAGEVSLLYLDKTGTLTLGTPRIETMAP